MTSRYKSLEHLRWIIRPGDPAQEVYVLSPIRVDDILRWVLVIHVKKGLGMLDRFGVLVDAVDELLGRSFNYSLVYVVHAV